MGKYDSIIHLPHKQSTRRLHMSMLDRAAQFAPFAALTGYGEEIAETARLTQRQMTLSDEELDALNSRLLLLKDRLDARPTVRITFFFPDSLKDGGSYQDVFGIVRRIDDYKRMIFMENGDAIPMDNICSVTDGIENQDFFKYLDEAP